MSYFTPGNEFAFITSENDAHAQRRLWYTDDMNQRLPTEAIEIIEKLGIESVIDSVENTSLS